MSEKPRKKGGQKGDGRPRGPPRAPPEPAPPPPAPAPKVERRDRAGIEIVRGDGSPPVAAHPPAPAPVHAPPPPKGPLIEAPSRKSVELAISPDVQSQKEARRRAHTYTADQLKALRHDRELASGAHFRFIAEIQLYRRFIANGHRPHAGGPPHADLSVLQHRISTILLRLNVYTYQQVFTEILSLGCANEAFVLSYVNVVFKQAVMNPPLALLYAELSRYIAHVLTNTPFGQRIRDLFLERCDESFAVPRADTDKPTLILVRGIVTFAGHLLRDAMLPASLLAKWSDRLLQSGTAASLDLLVQLLVCTGSELAAANPALLERLRAQVDASGDSSLLAAHASLVELVGGALPASELNERELRDEGLRQSPSIDRELSAQYPTLFKRSSSVPLELAEMADADVAATVAAAVAQYAYSQDLAALADALANLGYERGDPSVAADVLRAVVEMPVDKQMVAAPCVVDLLRTGYYGEEAACAAVRAVAADCVAEGAKARKLVRIFAQLIAQDIAAFDQFEELFEPLRGEWGGIVPEFLEQLDQLRGEWIDDIMESEFWRNARFLGVETIFEKIAKLKEWEMVGFLPQYEIASLFADGAQAGKMDPDLLFRDDLGIDGKEVAPLIFEILAGIGEIPAGAVPALKRWFAKHKEIVRQLAGKFDGGARVAALLQ